MNNNPTPTRSNEARKASAYERPRSLFVLVIEGEEVLRKDYAIERGRHRPLAFEKTAQKAISGALEAMEPHEGQKTIRYSVLVDGVETIRSFATKPATNA